MKKSKNLKHDEIKKLINYLKQIKDISLSVFVNEENKNWNYYYSVSGFIFNDYFHFVASNHKNHNVDCLEMYRTTDTFAEIELNKIIKNRKYENN